MKKKKIFAGLFLASAALCLASCSNDNDTPIDNSSDNTQQTANYTVTFSGANIANVTTNSDGKVTRPQDPIKEGYTFDGWYMDEACTKEFSFDTVLTGNITIYAKWTAVSAGDNNNDDTDAGGESQAPATYTVDFSGANVDSQTITEGEKVKKPEDPVKAGHVFVGWYTALENGELFDFENITISSSTTIYAIFREKTLFERMSEASNNVMIEDFSNASELEKFEAWGTKGVYVDTNSSPKDFIGNNVVISNGVAQMVDTTDKATKIYIDTETMVYGVLEATFDITLTNQANSWTPVQIYGSNNTKTNNEIFGLRTDDGSIKYRINGGSTYTAGINNITTANSTVYNVYFKLNLTESTLTMSINGSEFVTNLALDGAYQFSGIVLTSSDKGNKLLALDNVAINYTAAEQTTIITNLNSKLDSLYTALTTNATYVTNGIALENALIDAKAVVSQTATEKDAFASYNIGVAALDAVLNDTEQALADGKQTAITALKEEYKAEDYLINKAAYDAAIANMEAEINKLTELGQIEAIAYAEATKIAAILNDTDQMAISKAQAIADMKTAFGFENYTNEGYTEDLEYLNNKAAYENAINTFDVSVNALSTADTFVSDLAALKEETSTVLDAIATDAEKLDILKPTYLTKIDSYKQTEIENIPAEFDSVITQIAVYKSNAKTAIEACLTAQQVLEQYDVLVGEVDNAIASTQQKNGELVTSQLELLTTYAADAIAEANLDAIADATLIASINSEVQNAFNEITGAEGYIADANDQVEAILSRTDEVKANIEQLIAADAFVKSKEASINEFLEYYEAAKAVIAENDPDLANGFDGVYNEQSALISETKTTSELETAIATAKAAIDAKTNELFAYEYTVEFVTNYDGVVLDSSTVVYGTAVKAPANPTATDAVFVGWFEDEALETEFDFTAVRYANVTLYGKWNDALIEIVDENHIYDYSTITELPTSDDIIVYTFNGEKIGTHTTNTAIGGIITSNEAKSTRCIKIILNNPGYINASLFNTTGNNRDIFVDVTATKTVSATAKEAYGYVQLGKNVESCSFASKLLPAGTYYFNWSGKGIGISSITVIEKETLVTEYTGIDADLDSLKTSYTSAEITTAGFELDLTGLALTVKGSNELATLANPVVKVNDYENFLLGTAGEYNVVVSYGKFTNYSYTISVIE